jgi:hypothetical protein
MSIQLFENIVLSKLSVDIEKFDGTKMYYV